MIARRKDALVVLMAALGIAFAFREVSLWRRSYQSLHDELNRALAEVDRLRQENKALKEKNALASAGHAQDQRAASELLKLRNEVTQYRKGVREVGPEEAALKAWTKQILTLKQAQERRPDTFIPELQLASEKDWADAAWGLDLSTEDGVREALSKLRDRAVNAFFDEVLRPAVKRYVEAHNGALPAELSEVKGYLGENTPAFDDEVFQRYRLLQSGQLSSDPSKQILELAVHVDPDYDSNHEMGINGASGGRYNRVQGEIEMASETFARAHNGQLPNSAAQLNPYLNEKFEQAAVEHYLSKLVEERRR